MTDTKVVFVRSKEWKETPECDRAYIGRRSYGFPASPWANPFKIEQPEDEERRAEAIRNHELWLRQRMRRDPQLIVSLRCLRGKLLGCWCKTIKHPNRPCHGDLLKWLIYASDQQYLDWLNSP